MEKIELITAKDFCTHHNVSYTFITTLEEAGLTQLVSIEEELFIDNEHIGRLEKLARLHRDLDIDMEGMAAIARLLQQVEELQQEVRTLSQKLRLYSNNS
ncbi:MAG: chaperone modulator CbpM [Taibaiella sp.]|nr:chaperone modulator CbpM [Taibaiella sp.]